MSNEDCLQNANVGGYANRGFVEVLAASQTPGSSKWFQGTADAVRHCLWLFEESTRSGVEDYLILSGLCLQPLYLQTGGVKVLSILILSST